MNKIIDEVFKVATDKVRKQILESEGPIKIYETKKRKLNKPTKHNCPHCNEKVYWEYQDGIQLLIETDPVGDPVFHCCEFKQEVKK